MNIFGVDHVELFTADAEAYAEYLCTHLGFQVQGRGGPTTGLAGQQSILVGQGHIRVLVTTGHDAGHPAADYVARHEDGIGVVAFAVDDASAAFADAVARGATAIAPPATYESGGSRVVTAAVSGFGDVVHRLVERSGARGEFLPGAITMAEYDDSAGFLLETDHAAVCLPAGDLVPTVRYYEDVFGFTEIFQEYIEIGEQGMDSKVVQSPSGGVTFTLIEPDTTRRPGQIDDFLSWHGGAGVQHLAFRTEDIVSAVRAYGGRGVAFAVTPGSYYDALGQRIGSVDVPVEQLREVGVLVDQDHWGQMFQIFTQSTHPRRTLFLELIERHGARTFGSSNIKALYEAKERELADQRATVESGPLS